MMKNSFFLVLCLLLMSIFSVSFGQNLVPNPSFENFTNCPNSPGEISYATPWFSATDATPDYFNSCNSTPSWFSVPENWVGYQDARTGNAYSGLGIFFNTGSSNSREYMQVPLTDTLILGNKYIVSFYVSKADSAPILATKLGAYLSASALIQTGDGFIDVTPQIESQAGSYLTDNINWIKVSDTITAIGDEKFLTIGFFYDDANADTIRAFHTNNGLVTDYDGYYYIDDVSIELDTTLGIEENDDKLNDFLIYPLPADNEFRIQSTNQVERVEILNQSLNVVKIFGPMDSYDVSALNDGLYYLKISLKNDKITFKKLLINKK